MKIITPEVITSDVLTSNVPITETEWTAGTYTTGTQRYVGTKLYEVVADPSTSDEPTAGVLADPPTWISVGEINRFKMFDFIIGSKTVQTGAAIDVTVDLPTLVNAVAAFEIDANTMQVIVTDPVEGEVFNETKTLNDNSGVNNMYQYFFSPIARATEAVFLGLPAYLNADVRVVFDVESGDVSVGELIVGKQKTLGMTLQNFTFEIEDFSRKERDEFGNFVIIERRFAKLSTYDVFLNNIDVNPTFKILSDNRAKPVVYIGADDMPETLALGFFRDFSTLRTGPNSSEMTLEIEGLV